jgi:hypothetical protein
MRRRIGHHTENLRDWTKAGGPIDPTWTRDLQILQKDLHRSQCRAARRVFTSGQESSSRCLGAYLVQRTQRHAALSAASTTDTLREETEQSRRYLAELLACNKVGTFQRFGEDDIAFVCDFCDGHIVWEDLNRMPNARTTQMANVPTNTTQPDWQATGQSRLRSEPKQVVFAPVAIANHSAPLLGDWQAKLQCPFCEADAERPQDEDDEEYVWKPENEYEDLVALQDHLEWQHAGQQNGSQGASNCSVM